MTSRYRRHKLSWPFCDADRLPGPAWMNCEWSQAVSCFALTLLVPSGEELRSLLKPSIHDSGIRGFPQNSSQLPALWIRELAKLAPLVRLVNLVVMELRGTLEYFGVQLIRLLRNLRPIAYMESCMIIGTHDPI